MKNTCRLRHCEFFHLMGSRSLIPVIVPIYLKFITFVVITLVDKVYIHIVFFPFCPYLLVPDSSVSNIIRKRMPSDIWLLHTAL